MTDAELARWEAQEQQAHAWARVDSSLPVDVTLALIAEVRRLRAEAIENCPACGAVIAGEEIEVFTERDDD